MADSTPPGRTFRGQSQEERVAQRRKQLLEAGLVLFGTKGFHGSSVRDICAEAKLTERYFYESFQNREALFHAVYDEAVERVRAAIIAALGAQAGASAEDTARAGLRAYFTTLREEPLLARVLLIDVLTVGEGSTQSIDAMSSFVEMVSATIIGLYPELRRYKLDPQWIGNGLVGATVFMAVQWARGGFKEPVDRIVDNCGAFVAGLAALVRTQIEATDRSTDKAKAGKRPPRERRAS